MRNAVLLRRMTERTFVHYKGHTILKVRSDFETPIAYAVIKKGIFPTLGKFESQIAGPVLSTIKGSTDSVVALAQEFIDHLD